MKRAALLLITLVAVGILACNGTPEASQTISPPETEAAIEQPTNTPVPPTVIPTATLPVPSPTALPTATLEPTLVPEPIRLDFNGQGNKATDMFYLKTGLVRFECNHQGQRNFIVWLLDDMGDEAELIANEIGNYQGSGAFNVRDGGQYLLSIDADGAWGVVFIQQ